MIRCTCLGTNCMIFSVLKSYYLELPTHKKLGSIYLARFLHLEQSLEWAKALRSKDSSFGIISDIQNQAGTIEFQHVSKPKTVDTG